MSRIIRRREVCERVGLSYSSIYRKVKAGTFPAPVRLGVQAIGWLEHEVETWLEERSGLRFNARRDMESSDSRNGVRPTGSAA